MSVVSVVSDLRQQNQDNRKQGKTKLRKVGKLGHLLENSRVAPLVADPPCWFKLVDTFMGISKYFWMP